MRTVSVLMIAVAGLGCLGGAYWLGTRSANSSAISSAPTSRTASGQESGEANPDNPYALRIPTAVAPPQPTANVGVEQPTAVLLGEVKVPDTLLRAPQTANDPGFVVPNLGK